MGFVCEDYGDPKKNLMAFTVESEFIVRDAQ